ncbi:MAG: cytochrome d ubiquinol oxidase subunit II [Mycobacterium leprae]
MQLWLGLNPVVVLGFIYLLGLVAYAVLGGADFGGGILDLFLTGPRAAESRLAISEAMEPVWEANHVWLILLIVLTFVCFPPAFAAMMTAFFGIFHLVLLGIILRGAAFVFRNNAEGHSSLAWSRVFSIGSLMTPFLLGDALGALSSGAIRAQGTVYNVSYARAFFSPLSLLMGAMGVAIAAYVGAVFMTVESKGLAKDDFRQYGLIAGTVVALLSLMLLPALHGSFLWAKITAPAGVALMLTGIVLAIASGWALSGRKYHLARVLTVAEVAVIISQWAVAQWPYIIYPDFPAPTTGAIPTILFTLNAFPFGLLILIPSLIFLFVTFKRNQA